MSKSNGTYWLFAIAGLLLLLPLLWKGGEPKSKKTQGLVGPQSVIEESSEEKGEGAEAHTGAIKDEGNYQNPENFEQENQSEQLQKGIPADKISSLSIFVKIG